jgi:hypothetical protein
VSGLGPNYECGITSATVLPGSTADWVANALRLNILVRAASDTIQGGVLTSTFVTSPSVSGTPRSTGATTTNNPSGNSSSSTSGGLSTGSKVAIGVVIPAAALAILAIVLFIWRRRRSLHQRKDQVSVVTNAPMGKHELEGDRGLAFGNNPTVLDKPELDTNTSLKVPDVVELSALNKLPSELPSTGSEENAYTDVRKTVVPDRGRDNTEKGFDDVSAARASQLHELAVENPPGKEAGGPWLSNLGSEASPRPSEPLGHKVHLQQFENAADSAVNKWSQNNEAERAGVKRLEELRIEAATIEERMSRMRELIQREEERLKIGEEVGKLDD